MDNSRRYLEIVAHYEACLERHGDSNLGVDWPNAQDADRRYDIMLGIIPLDAPERITLLDFGCGAGHLYERIQKRHLENRIAYSGLDLSPNFVALCHNKFPDIPCYCCDVLAADTDLPEFDYIVMNGVLTEKITLSEEEMLTYFQALIIRIFAKARVGLAFNVMSKLVDWERSDLFHLSLDILVSFLTKSVSRHFVIRHDYGLYEYTVYVYR